MSEDIKEPVNFRLGRRYKRALARLATEQDRTVGELVREAVQAYVEGEERRAWEAEARKAAEALAEEAKEPGSAEAEMLEILEANLEEYAKEWIWEAEA